MSEEVIQPVEETHPKPKDKPGRKPLKRLVQKVVKAGVSEAKPAPQPTGFQGWPSGKYFRCVIGGNPGEFGYQVDFTLGDAVPIHVVRGAEVILPIECKGLMDDSVTKMPVTDWRPDGTTGPTRYKPYNRFPYQDLGPATREEYVEFVNSQRGRPFKDSSKN